MTKNFTRIPICDGVTFHSIGEKRFKTGRLTAAMLLPLSAETASANAVLPYLLRRSCRRYPTFRALNEKLSSLYGASLQAQVYKLGEVQVLAVSAVGLDDRYALEKEEVAGELAELLCSILFDPAFENGQFRQEDIDQEKRQLIEQIDSEFNDKRIYAQIRCEELMCRDEAFGVGRFGTKKQVEALTGGEIYSAWRRALSSARMELMMVGGSDPQKAVEGFQKAFVQVSRKEILPCGTQIIAKADRVKEFHDVMDVAQTKLVMGFRTGIAVPGGDVTAMRLMSALFGGTPHSKLFLNVREKLSLCYYCSSSYDRHKGIVMVQSGVEQKNIEKAREEILRQLQAVQEGDFSAEDLDAAKMSVANSFRTMSDYLGGLEAWYLSQAFEKTVLTPEQSAEAVGGVTKEQVVKAAQTVSLDTVYQLTGKEEA